MFKAKAAFSGFSVDDTAKAKAFYTEILGLKVDTEYMGEDEKMEMGLKLHLPDGAIVFVYSKENHEPATYTVLNFIVDNIDEAMDELIKQGVQFEHYNIENMPQDEKGILRGKKVNMGPDIAWFTDPAGNVLSIIEE